MDENEFRFETDYGILYAVNFEPERMFGDVPAYWFGLFNRSQKASPNDIKVRATVTCIIEEFFCSNPDILLYMCDSANDQQSMRSRLFLRWFNAYAKQQNFYIRTEMVKDEKEENYISMILQRSHPQFEVIIQTFNSIIEQFRNKPVGEDL
jgi:hypothetical protein